MLLHVPGLTAIRYASQSVDPVTGGLARVVGARLDASRRTVVPVTVSYWLAMSDQPDSVQVRELRQHLNSSQGAFQKTKHHKTVFDCLPGGGPPERGVRTEHLLAAAKKAGG